MRAVPRHLRLQLPVALTIAIAFTCFIPAFADEESIEELLAKANAALGHSRSVPPGTMSVPRIEPAEPRRSGWRGLISLPLALAAAVVLSILATSPRSAWEEVGSAKSTWFHVDEPANETSEASTLEDAHRVPKGRLTVKASGRGCRISLDGKVVGPTPVYDLELAAGAHAVECAPGSSRVLSLNVRVDPSEAMQVGFVVP